MTRPHFWLSAILAAALIWITPPTLAVASAAAELERARAALADRQGRSAVQILETALTSASTADRPALLQELRRAYELAANQAEAAGQGRLAQAYRDNLALLAAALPKSEAPVAVGESSRSEPDREALPQPQPNRVFDVDASTIRPPEAPAPIVEPASDAPGGLVTGPVGDPLGDPFQPLQTPPSSGIIPNRPRIESEIDKAPETAIADQDIPTLEPPSSNEPEQIAPPSRAGNPLQEADAAFRAGRYDDAGRIYGTLAQQGTLPDSRHDHWAYCRCVAVVRRINAQPDSREEWARIQTEIREIRKLAPSNWFSEYLRNLTQQRSAQMAQAQPSQFVVRGSSPEDSTTPQPPDRPAIAPSSPSPSPSASNGTGRLENGTGTAQPLGNWQVRTTSNFRIFHTNAELAERVAAEAEQAREIITRRWTNASPASPWEPKCDIYIYPDARTFAERTGQPEDSPGFSTMGLNAGRVIARRLNLRADAPRIVEAILPHEITHVVLADLFPTNQIPRWADEGIAVLSEPATEQQARADDLIRPLAEGRLFRVQTLMTSDYPDGRYWDLFYAQSVSLTRFLVEQADHARFIAFLQGAQRRGFEAELQRFYNIEGFEDLQTRWLAYAREMAASQSNASPERIASEEGAIRRE